MTRTPEKTPKPSRTQRKSGPAKGKKPSRSDVRNDVRDQPGHLSRRFRQIATAVQMEEYEAFGVTPLQFGVMLILRKNPGIDQVTLAAILAHNQANIGDVVARLSNRGLVVRERDKEDKRSWILFLTRDGRVMVNKLGRVAQRAQDRILDPLTEPERKRFMALLTKIVDGNEAVSRSTVKRTHTSE